MESPASLFDSFINTVHLMLQVTTLLNSIDEVQAQPQRTEADLTALREKLTAQGETVKSAKAVSSLL